MISVQWPARSQPKVAAVCILSLVLCIFGSHCIMGPLGCSVIYFYCGETSAWPGTCANFNPTNLALPKHHARLRCASFGWHVLQRKSYPHGQAMPKNTGAKTQKCWDKKAVLEVLGQKKFTLDTQVTHWHTASKRCQPA